MNTSIECAEQKGTGLALGESYDKEPNGCSLGSQEDRLPIGTSNWNGGQLGGEVEVSHLNGKPWLKL